MNVFHAFWMYLSYVVSLGLSGHTCSAAQQVQGTPVPGISARPEVTYQTFYNGSCVQSFLLALQSHGTIIWKVGFGS